MSDFGTIITAINRDGKSISNIDISNLSKELKKIVEDGRHTGTLGQNFGYQFQEESNSNSALVLLSEYYYGDCTTDDNESFDFVENTELEQAKEIITKLSIHFADLYFEAKVETF